MLLLLFLFFLLLFIIVVVVVVAVAVVVAVVVVGVIVVVVVVVDLVVVTAAVCVVDVAFGVQAYLYHISSLLLTKLLQQNTEKQTEHSAINVKLPADTMKVWSGEIAADVMEPLCPTPRYSQIPLS